MTPPPIRLRTERLHLRRLRLEDAPFILRLLNEPSFLEHIGDKGVRNLAQAEAYLQAGPLASYRAHGHGMDLVLRSADGEPLGLCGLLKREAYDHPDLGYAFVPEAWGLGYAAEAAAAALAEGHEDLGHQRILALVSPANGASIRLLSKLAFTRLRNEDPETDVYVRDMEVCAQDTSVCTRDVPV